MRGFTLTELGIVLGVVGLLLGAVWTVGSMVTENNAVNRAAQQVTKVVENIRDQFANTQNPPGWAAGSDVTLSSIDNLQLFPVEMRQNPSLSYGNAAENIVHALGGSLQVIASSKVAGPPNGTAAPAICNGGVTCFRIVLNGLTTATCTKLIEAMPVTDSSIGIVQIGVAVGAAAANKLACTGAPCLFSTAVPLATATGWCSGASDNSLFLDFKLHS